MNSSCCIQLRLSLILQILIDLFDHMLDRNPVTRWGSRQLKRHPFFDGVDWEEVAELRDLPPFSPSVNLGALLEGKEDYVTNATAENEAKQPLSDFDQALFDEWNFIDEDNNHLFDEGVVCVISPLIH